MKFSVYQTFAVILVVLLSTLTFSNKLNAQNRHKKKKEKEVVVVHSPPHIKYENLPKIGEVVKVAPKGAAVVNPGVARYHYYGGIFYKPYAGSFIVVRPPKCARVKVLPKNRMIIKMGDKNYFYYYGTFYCNDRLNDDYVITDPPKGAIVDAIPGGYEIKIIDDVEYIVWEDTWFKQVELEDGEIGYKVVSEN